MSSLTPRVILIPRVILTPPVILSEAKDLYKNNYYLRTMKIATFIISTLLCLTLSAAETPKPDKTPQEKYIEQFADLAVSEMYRTGVPASITLAQGLLESRYGLSELAVKGNNHFGIKCHNNWTGGQMFHDDDKKGECFRKYPSPEQSYLDHSDFLRYRDRYRFLFDYEITDYKSWAHGLKKAGYATDPTYANKLIKIIEDYSLHQYDLEKPKPVKESKKAKADKEPKESKGAKETKGHKEHKEPKVQKDEPKLPPSPAEIVQVQSMTEAQRQDFHFSLSREVYIRNGVPFVRSEEGEDYASIAADNRLFLKEILRFNDLTQEAALAPGTEVYLKPKKKQAVKGLDKHVVESGETMRSISQDYGIRLKNLYKINGMAGYDVPREGDIIRLRK